jgi:proline dehydrogenase
MRHDDDPTKNRGERAPMPAMRDLDFNNTEIAFASRSTGELRKARFLFQSFNQPLLRSAGPTLVNLAMTLRLPVTPIIRRTIFDQFCGGVTIDDCERRLGELARYGIGAILDYSVEGLGRETDFDAAYQELLRVIERSAGRVETPFAVFKATGIGRFGLLEKVSARGALDAAETAELERFKARFDGLCRAAHARGLRILVDAEETWIQPAIDELALAMMRELNRGRAFVFNTLQMYRHDRLAYLREMARTAKAEGFVFGAKLVRGAYMEKERERAAALGLASPIQPDKAATDRDFDAGVRFCTERLDHVALFAGTHNERSCRLLGQLVADQGLGRRDARVTFSQLLGMSDNLTFNLAHHGFNVAKYMPYGPVKAVLPYLFRRVEENSSIKGQVGRELQLIESELKRRH